MRGVGEKGPRDGSLLLYKECGVEKGIGVMSEQLVRLTSTTTNTHNFTTNFSTPLKFDDGNWSVAIAEIYILRVSRLSTLRRMFNSGEEIARWRFFYDTSGVGSTQGYIDQAVFMEVFDGLGDDVTKAEILQAVFADGFNKAMKAVKGDSTVTKAHWQDSSNDAMYQKFVWEGDDLVLKGAGTSYGADSYLRMSQKFFNLFYLLDNNNQLTKEAYPRSSVNYDFKDKVTWRLANNNTELYLYGNGGLGVCEYEKHTLVCQDSGTETTFGYTL